MCSGWRRIGTLLLLACEAVIPPHLGAEERRLEPRSLTFSHDTSMHLRVLFDMPLEAPVRIIGARIRSSINSSFETERIHTTPPVGKDEVNPYVYLSSTGGRKRGKHITSVSVSLGIWWPRPVKKIDQLTGILRFPGCIRTKRFETSLIEPRTGAVCPRTGTTVKEARSSAKDFTLLLEGEKIRKIFDLRSVRRTWVMDEAGRRLRVCSIGYTKNKPIEMTFPRKPTGRIRLRISYEIPAQTEEMSSYRITLKDTSVPMEKTTYGGIDVKRIYIDYGRHRRRGIEYISMEIKPLIPRYCESMYGKAHLKQLATMTEKGTILKHRVRRSDFTGKDTFEINITPPPFPLETIRVEGEISYFVPRTTVTRRSEEVPIKGGTFCKDIAAWIQRRTRNTLLLETDGDASHVTAVKVSSAESTMAGHVTPKNRHQILVRFDRRIPNRGRIVLETAAGDAVQRSLPFAFRVRIPRPRIIVAPLPRGKGNKKGTSHERLPKNK